MKNISILISLLVLITACTQPKYTHIGQEIIDGKVSEIVKGSPGRMPIMPKIYVQTPTETKEVEIPFSLEDRWNVGDSCLLIIEKYRENEK